MIGLAPPGRVRPWQLAAAVTAARKLFPMAKVYVGSDAVVVDLSEAVPRVKRGAVVEVGIRQAEAKAEVSEHGSETRPESDQVSPAKAELPSEPDRIGRERGPRLGRRVDPEELRQQLRGVVIR